MNCICHATQPHILFFLRYKPVPAGKRWAPFLLVTDTLSNTAYPIISPLLSKALAIWMSKLADQDISM